MKFAKYPDSDYEKKGGFSKSRDRVSNPETPL